MDVGPVHALKRRAHPIDRRAAQWPLAAADFRVFLRTWKWVILATMLLAVAGAGLPIARAPVLFEASAMLLATSSKIPSVTETERAVQQTSLVETYVGIVRSQAIAVHALREFRLDQAPYHYSPEAFLGRVMVVGPVRGTDLLTVRVKLPSAQLAADVANFVADQAVRLNSSLNDRDTVGTQDYLRIQHDAARRALDQAQAALKDHRSAVPLESLLGERWMLVVQQEKLEGDLRAAWAQLAALDDSITALSSALQGERETITLDRSVLVDELAVAGAAELGARDLKTLSGLRLRSQEINAVYVDARKSLIQTIAQRAGAKAALERLEQTKRADATRLKVVEATITEVETTRARLELNQKLAGNAYELFARKYDESALLVGSRGTELKIVDRAIVPSRALGSKALMQLGLAAALGLFVGVFVAVCLDLLVGNRRREQESAAGGEEA